nr:MAG TPA: hypothetical protein [Bacteriophage sp.]
MKLSALANGLNANCEKCATAYSASVASKKTLSTGLAICLNLIT